MNTSAPLEYPIRINRYLFLKGFCSRRAADRLISEGGVLINNIPAKLGQQVSQKDVISFTKKAHKQIQEKKWYIIFNKPIGVVSHNPQFGERSIESYFKDIPVALSPIGRLDKASHGLLLLSNDGRIVDALLNPSHNHSKEYVVEVDKRIDKNFIQAMQNGVKIEGYQTKPTVVKKIQPRVFHITLTEGKKHQIRRMCAALGYQVKDLKRIRINNLELGKLAPGAYRELNREELNAFLNSL
ncbi:MAG: pseudouridine synthase [Patescibacteria group bacterium]